MNAHVADLAGLYALGALEPDEIVAVDTHAAACAECRAALGRAEATVTALDDAFVPLVDPPDPLRERIARAARDVQPLDAHEPARSSARALPAPHPAWLAAAALVVGIATGAGLFGAREAAMHDALARDDVALATLVDSHFDHAPFKALAPGAPHAKAIYARDGRWVYVIVESARCACRVAFFRHGVADDLGAPPVTPGGTTATLLANDAGRPDRIELVGPNGAPIAAATLAYPPVR